MLLAFAILLLAVAPFQVSAAAHTDFITYVGGSFADTASSIGADSAGNVYLIGTTNSPDFPLTSTQFGAPDVLSPCTFIAKFNPAGFPVASICLPNASPSLALVDPAGNVYVYTTSSPRANLSLTVVKLSTNLDTVLLTIPVDIPASAMALDRGGNLYITGSAAGAIPTTSGAFQAKASPGNCPDKYDNPLSCAVAFVAKLSPSGTLVYATYLGGSGPDTPHAIAVDSAGNAWIAGETASSNFPTTANAIQKTFSGEVDDGPLRYGDAFIAKLDATGSKLLYSTYLGGKAPDAAFAVAIDSHDNAYISGGTQSSGLPTTPGVVGPSYGGPGLFATPEPAGAAFLLKLSPTAQEIYLTYVTGLFYAGQSIVVDSQEQAIISTGVYFNTAIIGVLGSQWFDNGPLSIAGSVFLSADASKIINTSPVSGQLVHAGNDIVYAGGTSMHAKFLATPHAYQPDYGGGFFDAFLAKVDFAHAQGLSINAVGNAASTVLDIGISSAAAVAPNEIISIFGNGFGTSPTVTINDSAIPVIYASDKQINAIIGNFLGPMPAFLSVHNGDQTYGPIRLSVVDAAPGIFTSLGTGIGQAAAINQDGSVNSAQHPAVPGSVVSIYMTGAGRMNGNVGNSVIAPLTPPYATPVLGIGATIGNLQADVVWAGQAPGLVIGVVQVNVRVPSKAPAGLNSLSISVGNYRSSQLTGLFVGGQ